MRRIGRGNRLGLRLAGGSMLDMMLEVRELMAAREIVVWQVLSSMV